MPLYGELATQFALPAGDMLNALESGAFEERIRADFDGGVRSGVNGTPSFFINGTKFDGPDFEALANDLRAAVDR
jgi:protein-disulfide isomerase